MTGSSSKLLLLALASLPITLTTGCGIANLPSVKAPATVPAATRTSGVVMGGQQPVGGVTLQIYTVGTAGYGSAASPLGPSFMTTPSGNFNFPSYTCPSAGALTFLIGTGGQPIAATANTPAVTNANLAMMVGLGACSTVGSTYVNMNEVTTVATIWSLSPFMTGMTNIGAPASNTLGIQLAFAAINKVTDTTNGHVAGPMLPANATLPLDEINTLADILEQCVNSGGGSASDTTDGQTNGTGCGKLFYLATVSGVSAPTDTLTAAMNIAQHPAQNVAKLNALRSSSPVFQPTLSVNAPPSDWTIAIRYTGGGLNTPQGVAIDQRGNIWMANPGNSSVSAFTPAGTSLSGTNGFTVGSISTPYALAIDQNGSVWVSNSGNNSVTKLDPTGATGANYSGNGLNLPIGIAIDSQGGVFLANSGANAGTFSGFDNTGTALPGSPFNGTGLNGPLAIAISPQ